MPASNGPRTGDPAPDFELPDQDGKLVRLSDYRGRSSVVLFFYPRDETPGCSAEACSFRDEHAAFADSGAEVLGVSGDSPDSHRRFIEHFALPYRLLCDDGDRVRSLYGVKKTLGLIPGRVTFVIDRDGIVRSSFSSQFQASRHASEALQAIRGIIEAIPPPGD
ncbi:MAG: peroxiredoxin [Isosphaeraceae bacterium]